MPRRPSAQPTGFAGSERPALFGVVPAALGATKRRAAHDALRVDGILAAGAVSDGRSCLVVVVGLDWLARFVRGRFDHEFVDGLARLECSLGEQEVHSVGVGDHSSSPSVLTVISTVIRRLQLLQAAWFSPALRMPLMFK